MQFVRCSVRQRPFASICVIFFALFDLCACVSPGRFRSTLGSYEELTGDQHLEYNAFIAKPVRIASGSNRLPKKSKKVSFKQPPWLKCGVTHKVHSGSDKGDTCPKECPFFAQDRTDMDFCSFACVTESDCNDYYKTTQIGDATLGVCRSCMVDGCAVCDTSTTEDRCAKCQHFYELRSDGQCYSIPIQFLKNYVAIPMLVLVVLVVIWLADFMIRPTTNTRELDRGMEARERMKLHMPADAQSSRSQFPLSVNLCSAPVAGPGVMLHFTFQVALIVWAVFISCFWMGFATFIDEDLWRLGTRRFGTPRENCILVAWGYETQQALMWTKVAFLWLVYAFSILYWMAYGVLQLRSFQAYDYRHKTMKDFVLMLRGIPPTSGEQDVEEDLKVALQRAGARDIVGVSAAWDFSHLADEMEEDVKNEVRKLEEKHIVVDPIYEPPPMNPIRNGLYQFERTVFGLPDFDSRADSPEDDAEVASSSNDQVAVTELQTSPFAFAVFETEEARDFALEECQEVRFGGEQLELVQIDAEPDTVQWQNFNDEGFSAKAFKVAIGFFIIGAACLFWACVFYAPYAYYVMTFNYDNGRQPGFIVGFAFSMIVVVGNAIMYEVCARISDWVGFEFKDSREVCYMVLYLVACLFNVLLDFVTTFYTAQLTMEGMGFRTYFGVLLKDVTDFTEKFETYGMQRSLAENTFAYAFPSTFLIPFLIEPFAAIIAPLYLGKLIVRSHPEVKTVDAEEWLAMAPMEMGRYADLLLNIILGILIFYFPGGYTWSLFLGMAISHVWIYAFDHYRVLRMIPACVFASYDIEWWCQAMIAPIIGVVASCLTFKSNCEPGYHCLKGPLLILACTLAWLVHTIAHVLVLSLVLPRFGEPPPEQDIHAGLTYTKLASQYPCNWFTSNPVHCLRSQRKYRHSPSCSLYVCGREHLMKANPTLGCYYEGQKA